jgi:O-antigen ligase
MIAQWPFQIVKLGGALICVAAVFWALAGKRRLIPQDSIFVLLGLLVVLGWASAAAVANREALDPALAYTSFWLLYWQVWVLSISPDVPKRMAAAMLVSGVIIALIGFVQFRFPFIWGTSTAVLPLSSPTLTGLLVKGDLTDTQTIEGVFRIDSLVGTPDFLGMTMQILLPFAVIFAARQRTALGASVGIVAAVVLVAALLLSFTRAVMITTAVISVPLIMAKVGWRRSLPYVAVGAAIVAAVILTWEPLRNRAASISGEWFSTEQATAAGWRRHLLPVALDMFADHFWLGTGIGQHQRVLNEYLPQSLRFPVEELAAPLHNAYLTIAIEEGIGGLVLLILVVLVAWRRLRQLQVDFQASGQSTLYAVAQAAEAAWVPLSLNIFFYPSLANFRYFWVLLALIGALSHVAADQSRKLKAGDT